MKSPTTTRNTPKLLLRESEEFYRSIVQTAEEGIWRINAASLTDYVNPKMAMMMGYAAEEMLGRPIDDFLDDEGRAMLANLIERRKGGISEQFEFKYIRKDGSELWAYVSTNPITDAKGVYVGAVALLTDISARRAAEAALADEKTRLRTVLDLLPISIYVKDTDGRFVVANKGVAEALGATSWEQMIGKTDADYFSPAIAAAFREDEARVLVGEPVVNLEEPSVAPDGTTRTELTTKVPLRDGEGKIIGLVGVSRDITASKQADEATRASEALLRSITDHTEDGIFVKDRESRTIFKNPAGLRSNGLTLEQVIGRTDMEFDRDPVQAARFIAHDRRVMETGRTEAVEEIVISSTGGKRVLLTTKAPRFDEEGKIIGLVGVSRDITEHKQAEDALKESAEFRDNLIRSMQDGFSVLDATGVQLEVNPALCIMTGFSKEELVGIGPPFPYWPTEEYENIGAAFQETLKGNFADFELIFLRKNGERFPVIVSPAAIKNSDGETITYHATVKDITVRKQAEVALHESEERYKLLAENTDDIVGLNDTNGDRLYISPSYFRKTGWAPEDLQNVDWRLRIHPDDIEIVEQARLQNLAGLATRIEHRTRCKDGSWFWCETNCKAIPGPDGKVWRLLVWSHDITARMEAEAALRESEEQFRAIFEQAAVGVAMIDSNTGRFLKVNQRACDIARLTHEEMLNETFMDITHPDDLLKDLDNMEKLRLGVIPTFNMEKRYLHPDGSITWINLTVSPMWKPGEAPTRHIAVVKDITDRRRAEEALRNANQKLRLHFEQTPMAVIEWDLNFQVVSWNPAAQTIFGFSHEEAMGQHAAFIIPKIYRSQVGKVWKSLLKQKKGGERSSNENVRKDGKTILCDWYNTPLIDDHGIVTGVASLVLDMSEKKQAEEALLASEERYARALRGSNEGLWDWSNSTGELYLSPSWKALLGFSEDELPNHPDSFFTRLHPNDVARVQDAVAAHLERREPYDLDLRLRVKDGGYRWFRSRGEAERNDQGRAVRMAGTLYDISQRKFAEEKLAIEQDFNRALVSHTSALIIVLDELTRIIHVNAAFVRVLGYDLSMVAGRPLWETGMMSAAEIPRAKARYQQLLAGKEIAPVELRLKAKNGDWHVVELQPTAARHSDGSIDRIILTFTDMTERTRLQREILKISEQEQARIGHNLHDGVGQTMTGLSSLMESLESELSGAQRASATRIREIMQDALQEVRRMSHGLSPASVKNRGLSGALQLLADTLRFNHRTECVCEVDSTIKIEDAEKETHIFRIAQEASNNAIRHGHPKKVAISLQRLGEEECVLKIENDGAAIVKKKGKPSEGIGMQVMDYRANLIGGTLSITSSPRTGVSVSCRFPYADGGRKKSRSTNSWDI